MKEFRKNEQNFFICEECNYSCKEKNALSFHVKREHNRKKYYDKWIKEDNEEFCLWCKIPLKFHTFARAYKKYCCNEHAKLYSYNIGRKETFMKKYGVKSSFQSVNMKKIIQEKYGVTNISQLEEIKNKKQKTCLKNHGVKAGFLNTEGCFKKYGVRNFMQKEELFIKAQKSAKKILRFNSNLWYQGTFELDFLKKYYDRYPKIQRGPSIKYTLDNKNKIYYPDFYIPSLNLIIEIKSSYFLKKDLLINKKKKATIDSGFNYIMILDKNYNEFNQLYFH
jgi:hypothetical protein